jgi:hypothetical protein
MVVVAVTRKWCEKSERITLKDAKKILRHGDERAPRRAPTVTVLPSSCRRRRLIRSTVPWPAHTHTHRDGA